MSDSVWPHRLQQAPPSLGSSRQEHWSGLLFPSPMHEREKWLSHVQFGDPMDCSLPGSSIHRIFQARILEWVAIAFSKFFMLSFLNFLVCFLSPVGWTPDTASQWEEREFVSVAHPEELLHPWLFSHLPNNILTPNGCSLHMVILA